LFHAVGLAALTPQPHESFIVWWGKIEELVGDALRQGLNSLIILGAWSIWRHRNDCVFNAARLSIEAALSLAKKKLTFGWWQGQGVYLLLRLGGGLVAGMQGGSLSPCLLFSFVLV
jgi:nuclear pore complex protein Nup210